MIQLLCILLFAVTVIAGETVKEPELSPHAQRELRARLRKIVFPRIDFRDATLKEAFEFLVAKTKVIDPEPHGVGMPLRIREAEDKGVQIPRFDPFRNMPEGILESSKRISLTLKNVSLEVVLNSVCNDAGVDWKIGPSGVFFTRASPSNGKKR